MTGAFGLSIFIMIDITIISGIKIIIHRVLHRRSAHLFITLHQLSRGVFFISITGILFISDIVVLVWVTSNIFVMYLYLIPNVLLRFHMPSSSFFQKSLSIWSISSHCFFSMSFSIFSNHQRYLILLFILFLFIYQITSYIFEFFISSRNGSSSAISLLLISSSFLFGIIFLFRRYLCMLLRMILSRITPRVENINVKNIISLGISTQL